jgi:hypothetical protein
MASIDFDYVYIHDGTTLSTFFYQTPASIKSAVIHEGSIQTCAGGRTRAITGDAEPEEVTVAFNYVTIANRVILEGLAGDLVLYRDGSGRMFYGTYFDVDATDNIAPADTCNLSLTITEVTHSIVV